MTKTRENQETPRRLPLLQLAVLGVAAALWAIFLWRELVTARAGGTPFCAFGSSDCAELWDAPFASAVHRLTGVPVAGWGLVWGVVATVLPLLARRRAGLDGAVRAVAVAGAAGVAVLLGASFREGLFCTDCALTYVVTLVYAVMALKSGLTGAFSPRSLGAAAAAAVAVFLLLLYPGLRTPRDTSAEATEAMAKLAGEKAQSGQDAASSTSEPAAPAATPAASAAASAGIIPGGDDPATLPFKSVEEAEAASGIDFGGEIEALIRSLPDALKQGLADSLYFYSTRPFHPLRQPRALTGPADAPVRITEWSDALCSHCASLHDNLAYVFESLPPGSYSYDSRQFPLDGNCNSKLQVRGPESVRCKAALARICMEGSPYAFQYSGELFKNQDTLTEEMVFGLAADYAFRTPLEECIAREETKEKLAADVEYAWEYHLSGTPLVVVNGREAPPFGPFLYAIVLAGGKTDHPAFASLPEPSPDIPLPH